MLKEAILPELAVLPKLNPKEISKYKAIANRLIATAKEKPDDTIV